MSRDEFKVKARNTLFLLLVFISTNAFADVGVVVSNEFPSDKLMLENHIYKNAAVFEILGVYSGTVYAKARYRDIPSFCDAGYYFSENTTECVICDENHYCVGGENAVMEHCPDGLVSPRGTISAGECGKKFHVGEDIMYITAEKTTTPALAFKFDNKIYYAKMTPVSDGKKTMNANTTKSFHVLHNGKEYTVHDATAKDVGN